MNAAVIAIGVVSIVVSLYRWLRTAQREHYIPGSCRTTAVRWALRRPPNAVIGGAAALATAATIVFRVTDSTAAQAAAATIGVVLAGVFPWGMPIVGSPKLRFTRRALTLAAIAAALAVIALTGLGLLVGGPVAVAVVALVIPLITDGASALAAPVERRALERFRRQAESSLNRIDPFIIAVTGSWGKTSTKNHLRDLLADSANVVASPASWNNTAGLSRTINEHLTDATEVLIVEMGMYGAGEIRQMCSWVRPRIAVICSIGPMHLERVGSLDGIVDAKSEILERAETAVLWVDDERLAALADRSTVPTIWRVGSKGGERLDVEVEVDHGSDEIVVWAAGERIGSCPASSGAHAGNVGCAVAAALAYGASPRQLAGRLPELTNPDHRATTGTNDAGVFVIDDTFNSNPVGASAAIATLERAVPGDRAVVTPGMVELGPLQDDENSKLARVAVDSGATLVIVGWTNRRSLQSGASGHGIVVPDRHAAVSWVREHLGPGAGVLWENDLPDHYP